MIHGYGPSSNLLERALAMGKAVKWDHSKLPASVAAYLRVHGAQGVIDNGGYRYFFESDWEGQPPYSEFIDAYVAIGCVEQAADLARVVATFGHPNPHLHEDMRNDYIERHFDEDSHRVRTWGNALCGDDRVWSALEEFAQRNAHDFAPLPPTQPGA